MKQIEIAKHLLEVNGDCAMNGDKCEHCEFQSTCDDGDHTDETLLNLAITYLDRSKDGCNTRN